MPLHFMASISPGLRNASSRLLWGFSTCRQSAGKPSSVLGKILFDTHFRPTIKRYRSNAATSNPIWRAENCGRSRTPIASAFCHRLSRSSSTKAESTLSTAKFEQPESGGSFQRHSFFPERTERNVGYWLLASAAGVFGIVVFGGLTRLTESGLSITEWRPVTGSLPPMSSENWELEFEKYRASPEFKLLNPRMTLSEFKKIYYMEWTHRLWGRVIGLTFVLPAVYFIARRKVSPWMTVRIVGIAGLIGFQGVIGWWMVKSGLKDDLFEPGSHPRVSQYRLTAHLATAFICYMAMFWNGLTVLKHSGPLLRKLRKPHLHLGANILERHLPKSAQSSPVRKILGGLALMVFITAMSGGMVAGLDAGLLYNEFPYMGEGLSPPMSELFSEFYSHSDNDSWWRNMLENPSTVQLEHRILATTTFTAIMAFCACAQFFPSALRCGLITRHRKAVKVIAALALTQVTLGVSTLIYMVPLPLAALHQAGSLALLTSILYLRFRLVHLSSPIRSSILSRLDNARSAGEYRKDKLPEISLRGINYNTSARYKKPASMSPAPVDIETRKKRRILMVEQQQMKFGKAHSKIQTNNSSASSTTRQHDYHPVRRTGNTVISKITSGHARLLHSASQSSPATFLSDEQKSMQVPKPIPDANLLKGHEPKAEQSPSNANESQNSEIAPPSYVGLISTPFNRQRSFSHSSVLRSKNGKRNGEIFASNLHSQPNTGLVHQVNSSRPFTLCKIGMEVAPDTKVLSNWNRKKIQRKIRQRLDNQILEGASLSPVAVDTTIPTYRRVATARPSIRRTRYKSDILVPIKRYYLSPIKRVSTKRLLPFRLQEIPEYAGKSQNFGTDIPHEASSTLSDTAIPISIPSSPSFSSSLSPIATTLGPSPPFPPPPHRLVHNRIFRNRIFRKMAPTFRKTAPTIRKSKPKPASFRKFLASELRCFRAVADLPIRRSRIPTARQGHRQQRLTRRRYPCQGDFYSAVSGVFHVCRIPAGQERSAIMTKYWTTASERDRALMERSRRMVRRQRARKVVTNRSKSADIKRKEWKEWRDILRLRGSGGSTGGGSGDSAEEKHVEVQIRTMLRRFVGAEMKRRDSVRERRMRRAGTHGSR